MAKITDGDVQPSPSWSNEGFSAYALTFFTNGDHFMGFFLMPAPSPESQPLQWVLYHYDGRRNKGCPIIVDNALALQKIFTSYVSAKLSGLCMLKDEFLPVMLHKGAISSAFHGMCAIAAAKSAAAEKPASMLLLL